MARPKSDDPKVSISIRVKASVLAAYQAPNDDWAGGDWRARMHAALEREIGMMEGREPGIMIVDLKSDPANPAKMVPIYAHVAEVADPRPVVESAPATARLTIPDLHYGPVPLKPGALQKGKKK